LHWAGAAAHDAGVRLTVPDPSLVVLVGPSGSGKSTFARTHFRPTEVVSSDSLRAMLADDADDQGASGEAFAILALLLNGRLRRRLLTVVDATNLRATTRRRWLRLAARHDLPAIAIIFDLPDELFLAHDRMRPERQVGGEVVALQTELLRRALSHIPHEGFAQFYVLREPPAVGGLTVERVR
jgi:protein phosphatase